MLKRSLLSQRIIKVAQRAPGEAEVNTARTVKLDLYTQSMHSMNSFSHYYTQSVLSGPSVFELTTAIKFLVYFKWPTSLSPVHAFRTLCAVLVSTPHLHPGHTQTSSFTKSWNQWLRAEKRYEGQCDRNMWDQQKWQNEERTKSWRESGVTPRELLQLVQMMRAGGVNPNRLSCISCPIDPFHA